MSTADRRTIKAYAAYEAGLEVKPFEYVSRPLGDEDVEIAITHCGICGSDLHSISGGWGNAKFPMVPGHEIVGHVTAAGPGVTNLKVGDRVGVGAMVFSCRQTDTCTACATDRETYCPKMVFTYNQKYADGEMAQGGYADYVRVSSSFAFKIPDVIPSDAAAPLLCAGVTVYTPLKKYVKAGDRVGVVGIGGLGHLALQFAKALDATPVAFSQSNSKEQAARDLGAEDFVASSDPEAVKKARRSVNVLLVTADATNQPWDQYLSFIAVGGTLILVGMPNDKIQFRPSSVISGSITFVGSLMGGIKDTEDMLALAAARGVRAVVQNLPMAQANDGIQMVDQGKARYRVVLEN